VIDFQIFFADRQEKILVKNKWTNGISESMEELYDPWDILSPYFHNPL